MLKKRILTALVLVPITLLFLFYLPPAGFGILTAFITLVAAWEWTHLMKIKTHFGQLIYVLLIGFMLLGSRLVPEIAILFSASLWWLIAIIIVVTYPAGSGWWGKGVFLRGIMGFFVLIPTWVSLNFIRDQQDGLLALLFLLVLIWGADSCAYFVGKKWGKTKLAPRVSPGKSWQGLVGALLFAVLFAMIVQWFCQVPLPLCQWGVALSLIVVIFSVIGDLFESVLKRQANLKDVSQLLPGHGGLLDRIDSLTAAAPIFAVSAILLSLYFG